MVGRKDLRALFVDFVEDIVSFTSFSSSFELRLPPHVVSLVGGEPSGRSMMVLFVWDDPLVFVAVVEVELVRPMGFLDKKCRTKKEICPCPSPLKK